MNKVGQKMRMFASSVITLATALKVKKMDIEHIVNMGRILDSGSQVDDQYITKFHDQLVGITQELANLVAEALPYAENVAPLSEWTNDAVWHKIQFWINSLRFEMIFSWSPLQTEADGGFHDITTNYNYNFHGAAPSKTSLFDYLSPTPENIQQAMAMQFKKVMPDEIYRWTDQYKRRVANRHQDQRNPEYVNAELKELHRKVVILKKLVAEHG